MEKFSHHKGSTYKLAHRQRVKKFFVLEFHLANPDFIDKNAKVPKIQQADLVVVYNSESP